MLCVGLIFCFISFQSIDWLSVLSNISITFKWNCTYFHERAGCDRGASVYCFIHSITRTYECKESKGNRADDRRTTSYMWINSALAACEWHFSAIGCGGRDVSNNWSALRIAHWLNAPGAGLIKLNIIQKTSFIFRLTVYLNVTHRTNTRLVCVVLWKRIRNMN